MVKRLLLRDAISAWLLFAACLVGGVVLNAWRAEPLPLLYSSPKERLTRVAENLAPENITPLGDEGDVDLDAMRQLWAAHSALIIDARPEIFYRVGHIPSAISLPRDDFEAKYRELASELQNYRNQPVVVYCSSNECEDSQMVAEALQRLGLAHVRLFRGGWSEWESQNLPEETP